MDDQELIEKIKIKDERVISKFYQKYKNPFMFFIRGRFSSINDEEISEIYNNSMYELYKIMVSKENFKLTVTLKTFLFSIGKNQTLNYLRSKNRQIPYDIKYDDIFSYNEWKEDNINQIDIVVYNVVANLLEPCKTILELKFWKKLKASEIMKIIDGYTSKQSFSRKMRKCINDMKETLNSKLNEAEFVFNEKIGQWV